MSTRRAVEGKMLRHLGMSPDAAARLTTAQAGQTDWHGQCRVCRTTFTGSITALRGPCPKCGAGAGVQPTGGEHGPASS